MSYALDASTLLCLFNQEEGQERVRAALSESVISSVNYSEVIAKLVERGGAVAAVSRALDHLHLAVVDFDRVQAVEAGAFRLATRQAGLSFGDRACLALAKRAASSPWRRIRRGHNWLIPSASRSSWCAKAMAGAAALAAIAIGLNKRQRVYLLAAYDEDPAREASHQRPVEASGDAAHESALDAIASRRRHLSAKCGRRRFSSGG